MSCYHTRITRYASNEDTDTNPDACHKTDKNDTACKVTSLCLSTSDSCPFIQNEIGVIMCKLRSSEVFETQGCYRMCHSKGFDSNQLIESKCQGGPLKYEVAKTFTSSQNKDLPYYAFELENIDFYKKYVGPSNLPLDRCEALNVSASICLAFTKYRVLLCGGSLWKQAQCSKGNCDIKPWTDETTLECQYAVATDGVALCPSPKHSGLYCRFICLKKNGTCSKKKNRFQNTDSGRQLMSITFSIRTTDFKSLEKI